MTIVPFIIDTVGFCHQTCPTQTLLTLPLGNRTVLGCLAAALSPVNSQRIYVLAPPDAPDEYMSHIHRVGVHGLEVVWPDCQEQVFGGLETSDFALVIEPQHWPVGGYDFSGLLGHLDEYRGATHVISLEVESEGVREAIECDAQGWVRRIERLYDIKYWPEAASTAITYSLVPARGLTDLRFGSLVELRAALVRKGVLNRDLPLQSAVMDLAHPGGYLGLQEQCITEAVNEGVAGAFSAPADGVVASADCTIDGSARMIPPVIVHAGSVIEAGATIIGPAVIGPRSRIGRNAVVAQSVIVEGSNIPADTSLRHYVGSGVDINPQAGRSAAAAEVVSLVDWTHDPGNGDLPHAGHGFRRQLHLFLKRGLDILVASTVLLLTSPLLLVLALIIKLDSQGPVFFAHRRERKGGKEFPCIKFRTMAADAHQRQRELSASNQVDGPQFKINNDPRVTRFGRLLRATNLDELPQLINVLVGHMTLVGPRPSPFQENQICVPWRKARLSVRPGITGLWQVCRDEDRSKGDFHEWIYYDIAYVRHFSFWLDLKIILATLVTFGGRVSVPLSWILPQEQRHSRSARRLAPA